MESWIDQHGSPAVRTARLLLRPLQEGDLSEYVRVGRVSGEHLAPWSPAPAAGESLDDQFLRQLTRTRDGLARDADYRLAAWLADGSLVGMFNLNNVVRGVFQNAYAGWWLAADSVGRGYAAEALDALLGFAFAPPPRGVGLHRVQANIIPRNERSIRLARRVGMREEGLARAYLQIAGRWEDHIMFAKVAEEHAKAPL